MAICLCGKVTISYFIIVFFSLYNSVTARPRQTSSAKSSATRQNRLAWMFYHEPKTFVRYKGENLTINCSTTDPTDYILLHHKYQMLEEYEIVPDGKRIHQDRQSYVLRNLTHLNSGWYICHAINEDRRLIIDPFIANVSVITVKVMPRGSSNYSTTVEDQTAATKLNGSKPYIYFNKKSPVLISNLEKKPFELKATIKGLRPLKMIWMRDGRNLNTSRKFKTLVNDGQLVMEPPFAEEDSGTYSVMACNTQGCHVRGIQVLFYGSNLAKVSRKTQDAQTTHVLEKLGIIGGPSLIVIFAFAVVLVCLKRKWGISRSKTKTLKELGEEIKKQKQRGGGRSASLWNWNSGRESSADEMHYYNKKKSRKNSNRRSPDIRLKTHERTPSESSRHASMAPEVLSCENIIALFDSHLRSSAKPKTTNEEEHRQTKGGRNLTDYVYNSDDSG